MTAYPSNATPLAAPPLSLDTLTWESALTIGVEARKAGDQAKWSLGDVGAIVAHKWQRDSVKKFASEIGLDNHKRLYEYISVATYFESAHRADFPTLSWSHFREASRHTLPLNAALDWLTQAADKSWPVAALREAITGNPNEPIPRHALYECKHNYTTANIVTVTMGLGDIDNLIETLKRDGATLELRVSWLEAR